MTSPLKQAKKALQKYFGYSDFRGIQESVIQSLLEKKDLIALMPTGAGKSLCFQIPGLVLGGTTVVISPLIALMQDQVRALNAKGISAAALTSHHSSKAKKEILEAFVRGQLKFLYVSPEKAVTQRFISICQKVSITCIAVDEAHCICEWGADFRPEYTQLSTLINALPIRPTCAVFTATATTQTVEKISQILKLRDPQVVTAPSTRTNILTHCIPIQNNAQRLLVLLALLARFSHECVIIYTNTRVSVETIAKYLADKAPNLKVLKYHGGMSSQDRNAALQSFLQPSPCCLVATNAFGMGIDKPNVRCVIHAQIPGSIEHWYQEIGRAGRDQQMSFSFSLYSKADFAFHTKRAEKQTSTQLERLKKLAQLQYLCTAHGCQSQLIAEYFSTPHPDHCLHCSSCTNAPKSFREILAWCDPSCLQATHFLSPTLEWKQMHPFYALNTHFVSQLQTHNFKAAYQ